MAIASALLSTFVLGFELGRVVDQKRWAITPQTGDVITRAQFESELRRLERGVERELMDTGEKWRTLAGRVDKRLAEPRRKPQDELAVDGDASSMGGKDRARAKARRLGFLSPVRQEVVRHSPESAESAIRD